MARRPGPRSGIARRRSCTRSRGRSTTPRPRSKWDRVVYTEVLEEAGLTLMAEAEMSKRPYDPSILGKPSNAARGDSSLTRLLWAAAPGTAIRQTYAKELPLGLFLEAGPHFRVRAFNHDCAGHSRCNQYTRLASKMDIRARLLNVRHKPTFGFSFDYFVSTQQK